MGRLSSLLIGVISGASAAYYLSTEQGKKVTKKVARFVKDYQEDPQEVHESVKQTAKDVSKQAAEVIQQTKEKVGSGEITPNSNSPSACAYVDRFVLECVADTVVRH